MIVADDQGIRLALIGKIRGGELGDILMGRASVHSSKIVKWDELNSSEFVFAPEADRLVLGGKAPVPEDESGRHPVPVSGKWKEI